MDSKMVELAIEKLFDEIKTLKEEVKVLKNKLAYSEPKQIVREVNEKPSELLTLAEVRKILKMSRNSVLKLIEKGVINPIRLTERTIRYAKAEIQALTIV